MEFNRRIHTREFLFFTASPRLHDNLGPRVNHSSFETGPVLLLSHLAILPLRAVAKSNSR